MLAFYFLFIIRDLRDSSQPLSGEYLTSDDLKEDTDSCSSQYPSLGGHGSHSESVYEVGRDLESLSQSLEDLDTDLKRSPVKCLLIFVLLHCTALRL